MADWTVQLDPSSGINDRTMFDLNSDTGNMKVDQAGINWGDTTTTNQESQEGDYGSLIPYRTYPNRTISIPIFIGSNNYSTVAAALAAHEVTRSNLRQKVGLIKRAGGVLMRQRAGGPRQYADIVDATITGLQDQYGERGAIEAGTLTLEALGDFYGDEVTLDAVSISTGAEYDGFLQQGGVQAVILGDLPARCRIEVDNSSANDFHGLLWAVQSLNADTASSAALKILSNLMTALNGASASTSLTGLTGHINSTGMAITLPVADVDVPSWSTTLSSGAVALTHQGTFRVWARCASTGTPTLRLTWGQGSLAVPSMNDYVNMNLPGWQMVDLGVVRIVPTTDGTATSWTGVVSVQDDGLSTTYCDEMYFQPLDEGAGLLASVPAASPAGIRVSALPGTGGSTTRTGSTDNWANTTLIKALDNQVAQCNVSASIGKSNWLEATNFGLAVPSGATILGVQAAIYLYDSWGHADGIQLLTRSRATVQLIRAGTIATSAAASSVSDNYSGIKYQWIYGTATDLWGTTLTPTDVNNSGFGVAFAYDMVGSTRADLIYVDLIDIAVYYRLSTGLTIAQDAVVYAGSSCEIATDDITRVASSVKGPITTQYGDKPRLPPAGMEGNGVKIFIRPSEGDFNATPDTYNSDDFVIKPFYRPTYIDRA
jgi:hypothetical protein